METMKPGLSELNTDALRRVLITIKSFLNTSIDALVKVFFLILSKILASL